MYKCVDLFRKLVIKWTQSWLFKHIFVIFCQFEKYLALANTIPVFKWPSFFCQTDYLLYFNPTKVNILFTQNISFRRYAFISYYLFIFQVITKSLHISFLKSHFKSYVPTISRDIFLTFIAKLVKFQMRRQKSWSRSWFHHANPSNISRPYFLL